MEHFPGGGFLTSSPPPSGSVHGICIKEAKQNTKRRFIFNVFILIIMLMFQEKAAFILFIGINY